MSHEHRRLRILAPPYAAVRKPTRVCLSACVVTVLCANVEVQNCSWPVHNTSGRIRQALIYDFVKSTTACPGGDPGGHLHPREPNATGLWDDWSDEVRQYSVNYPAAAAGQESGLARL
eukprot:COSAG02_NODE_9485_length_2203_cov_2.793726_3_plen_118_part_00